jgi:UDP-N-acetylmuramate dehydrogenase
VNWHHFVGWTLDHGYGGLENLALIPGTVGAAPIQNIGAYGVEVKDYVEHVEAFDCESMQWVKLYQSDCQFSYRNSIFKTNPSRYVISTVVFNLPHTWQPRITYADLQSYFVNRSIDSIAPKDIFTAVCAIRSQKLPDPKVIGNVGSFFQNPIVSNSHLLILKEQYPKIVSYTESATHSKLAAGWLIDQCGFKGMQSGAVGVHDKQALVLTHRGNGSASELLALAKTIQGAVKERFGVNLVIEPVVYK